MGHGFLIAMLVITRGFFSDQPFRASPGLWRQATLQAQAPESVVLRRVLRRKDTTTDPMNFHG